MLLFLKFAFFKGVPQGSAVSNTPKGYSYADAVKTSNKLVKKSAQKRIQNEISKKEKQNFEQMKKKKKPIYIDSWGLVTDSLLGKQF